MIEMLDDTPAEILTDTQSTYRPIRDRHVD